MGRLSLTDQREPRQRFRHEVEERAGTRVSACYQCGKCSAGCPISFAMDEQPRVVMRLVQLGLKERALSSTTIWLCASCQTCSTRCPGEVRVAETMDVLRQMALREGYRPPRRVAAFHRAFLGSVRQGGRLSELGLVAGFKLNTGDLTSDIGLGLDLFRQGKIKLGGHAIHNPEAVRRIFDRVAEAERTAAAERGVSAAGAARNGHQAEGGGGQ
ncbi:MAG: 4Fe-4S dicluster domain-containing protein [Bacillota bacterium]